MIVDTNVWVELLRRHGEPGAKLAMTHLVRQGEASLCGPVLMELLCGTRPEHTADLSSRLDLFPLAPENPGLWREAGTNFAKLRAAGITVPREDVLIATVALQHECRVYSVDHHFDLMAPVLNLQLYAPGPGGTYSPPST